MELAQTEGAGLSAAGKRQTVNQVQVSYTRYYVLLVAMQQLKARKINPCLRVQLNFPVSQ